MDITEITQSFLSYVSQPDFFLPKTLGLAVLFIGWPLIGALKKRILTAVEHRCDDKTLPHFLASLGHSALAILLLLITLSLFGVCISAMIAALAGVSLALGLSMQSSISNLAAGIFIILFKPFKEGDFIGTSKTFNCGYCRKPSDSEAL